MVSSCLSWLPVRALYVTLLIDTCEAFLREVHSGIRFFRKIHSGIWFLGEVHFGIWFIIRWGLKNPKGIISNNIVPLWLFTKGACEIYAWRVIIRAIKHVFTVNVSKARWRVEVVLIIRSAVLIIIRLILGINVCSCLIIVRFTLLINICSNPLINICSTLINICSTFLVNIRPNVLINIRNVWAAGLILIWGTLVFIRFASLVLIQFATLVLIWSTVVVLATFLGPIQPHIFNPASLIIPNYPLKSLNLK